MIMNKIPFFEKKYIFAEPEKIQNHWQIHNHRNGYNLNGNEEVDPLVKVSHLYDF